MIQKGKILSILKKWPSIISFKALVIFALVFIPAISHGAVYYDDFEGANGGTFPGDWTHNNQTGFTNSTEQAYSPTHSFKTTPDYSEDSISLDFGSNTQGSLQMRFYCANVPNTGQHYDYCLSLGVSFGTGGSWDGVFSGLHLSGGNVATSSLQIWNHAYGFPLSSLPCYTAENNYCAETGHFSQDGWQQFREDWKTDAGVVYVRIYLNDYDSGWISLSDATAPTSVFLASYGNNGYGTPLGYVDNVYVYTDADTPEPPAPPVTDTSTRIISFSPADNSTTTSPVTFSLHGYINPDDLTTIKGVKLTLHNIDQNVILLGSLSPSDIYLFEGNATTSGDFYFSTSTPIGDGNYRLEACIERTYFWGWIINIFSPINDCQSHQFVVGEETFIGHISQSIWTETQSLFASSTATSTTALAGSCNPLSGSFSVTNCGAFLFVPDGKGLSDTMKSAREGILSRVPWGYLTRLYYLMNNSATTTLPSFTTTIQVGPGDDMTPEQTTLSFDVGDMVAGAGSLVDSIEDPIHGKTFRDVFYPIIQLVVALGVIITIVSDITGSHRHNDGGEVRQTKLS